MPKYALITGGTTGIGFAVADRFIELGYKVAISGRDQGRLNSAIAKLGGQALGILADHSVVSDNKYTAAICKKKFGKLDVLICNAGICLQSYIKNISEEDFNREMDTNFKGPIFLVASCLPLLGKGSNIIFTTSANDTKGIVGQLVYSASKAALRSAVRTLAAELAVMGIRVNAVAPGLIDTPIFDKAATADASAQSLRDYEAQIPALKRLGQPEEVATVFSFLASEQASYITGANLRTDGGWADL